MIANDDNTDPLYILLQRAVYEDGTPEGENAWLAFKRKVNRQKGRVVFMTEDYANPLMFIVKEQKAQIEAMEAQNYHLHASLQKKGITPTKVAAKDFPWNDYPDLERRCAQMLFLENCTETQVKDYVTDQVPEVAENYTGRFINSRFFKRKPDKAMASLIEVQHGDGPITWMELWAIGSAGHGKGWPIRVVRYGNSWDKFQVNGKMPDNWNSRDPNKFISGKNRAELRVRYHNDSFLHAADEMLWFCEQAGENGLTTARMQSLGLDMRRTNELEGKDLTFIEGDHYIHHSFAAFYPNNPRAQMAMAKHSEEIKTTDHGSEHRDGRRAVKTPAAHINQLHASVSKSQTKSPTIYNKRVPS